MAFAYPEFHGSRNEDVEDFLERMEVACISNHIQEPPQILRLLQICLKSEARTWLKIYEEKLRTQDPPVVLELQALKRALLGKIVKEEDPEKVWHEVQSLVQKEDEPVEEYIKKFSALWEHWCRTLVDGIPSKIVKKSMFVDGLLPDLRLKVNLKNPRLFDDAVRVAKERESKWQKMKDMGLCLDEGAKSVAADLNVNLVEVGRNDMLDLVEKESQRPRQVQRGMYYVPSGFFPGFSKHAKVKEKLVDERNGDVCGKKGVDEMNVPHVDVEVEKKDLHVDIQNEGLKSCFESFASDESQVDSPSMMDVMAVNDSTLESSSRSYATSDVESMDVHANVDLDDDLAYADDDQEEDTDVESSDKGSLQDFDMEEYVCDEEISNEVETVCSVDVENREQDHIVMDFLAQLDDTRGVGKTQKEDMYVDLVQEDLLEENGYDLVDVVEGDAWDIASFDAQEPEVDLDAHMVVSVTKASLHVAEMLKRTSTGVDEDLDAPKLEGCDGMPILEGLDVYDDAIAVVDVYSCGHEYKIVGLWPRRALMEMMLVAVLPQVLRTIIDVFEIWHVVMQPLISKDAGRWNGVPKMFPFDPGGDSDDTSFFAADHE